MRTLSTASDRRESARGLPARRDPRLLLALVLVALLLTPLTWAQNMRDLIDAALDEQIKQKIEITERPIRDALTELEKATGLHFVLTDQVLDLMPYGAETRVSIVVQDMSVRSALGRIFTGLGLELRVAHDRIEVDPAPWLERLGRRLSIEEVELLQYLHSAAWAELKPAPPTVQFRLDPVAPGEETQHELLKRAFERDMASSTNVVALAALEKVTQSLGCSWVPAGRGITVYSRTEDIQQRLDRPFDADYRRIPLDELLLDLGRRTGIKVRFEPGVLQRVQARDRHVDLVQRNTTVRQILELLVGNTGLVYEVLEDGIGISVPPPATGAPATADDAGSRVVAILRVPVGADGTTIDFLIRAAELPPEFKQLRERKLPQVIELLRKDAAN